VDGAAPVPVGGSKPRALLAALLLDLGTVVPAQRLVDVVWGEAPPDTARGLVQTYVSALRRALHRDRREEIILTRPPVSPRIRANRDSLRQALTAAGLVNQPQAWWHWSYGDQFWCFVTGAPATRYGPAPGGLAGSDRLAFPEWTPPALRRCA